MLSESTSQTLNYGHLISLSPPSDPHSFIYSDGFIKPHIFSKNFQTQDYKPSSNFLHSLFQILPSFLNSNKKAALNLKTELKEKYPEANNVQRRKEVINDIQEKVAHEYKFNMETAEKLRDTPIAFDTQVQFLHISSNKFLACIFEEADYEKENFRMELHDFPSEKTHFKFLPVYTYQKRSDGCIFIHDSVYIVWASLYLNKIPYFHLSQETIEKIEKNDKKDKNEKQDKNVKIEALQDKREKKITQKIIGENANLQMENFITEEVEELHDKNHRSPHIFTIKEKYKLETDEQEEDLDLGSLSSRQQVKKSIIAERERKQVSFSPKDHTPKVKELEKSIKREKMEELKNQRNFSKREVNVSLDLKSLWRINLFRNNMIDDNILCYGDIIWLNFSERNATLIVNSSLNGDNEVQFILSSFSDQQAQNFIGDTNGMWIIEHEDYRKGDMVQWSTALRLKHMISGKYLSIKNVDNSGYNELSETKICFQMESKQTPSTLFDFTMLPTTVNKTNLMHMKYVTKDAFIKLRHVSHKAWVCLKIVIEKNNNLINSTFENMVTVLTDQAGDEIAFKIFKANQNEIWESNFLICCSPIIRKIIGFLEEYEKKNKKFGFSKEKDYMKVEKKFRVVNKCLNELNMFTLNEILNTSPDQKYGMVNSYRQKILRELYFIDDCIHFLNISLPENELKQHAELFENKRGTSKDNEPKENSMFSILRRVKKDAGSFSELYDKLENKDRKMKKNYFESKIKIAENLYRLLINICKDCPENENYVYKKIPEFQYQAKYLNTAVRCVISVISNNESILNNIADDIRIQKTGSAEKKEPEGHGNSVVMSKQANNFLEYAQTKENNLIVFFMKIAQAQQSSKLKNFEYLKFFRAICKFQNKAMSMNQEILHRLFEESLLNRKSFFLPINIENKKMKIEFDGKTKFLNDFFKNGPNSEIVLENFPYFLEQLNLYSDLALGRNFLWKTYLEKIFPINFLFSELANENLSDAIRSSFCNLALTLYVDHEPLNPLIVPNMCRVFNSPVKKMLTSPTKNFGQLMGGINKLFKKEKQLQKKDSGKNMIEKNLFEFLIEKSFHYISKEKNKIVENYETIVKKDSNKKSKHENEQEKENQKSEDFLNNVLTLDIIRLSSTLIKFDILRILDQTQNYALIIPDLIILFEYDKHFPSLSYCLSKIRENVLEKTITKNILLSGFKNAMGSVVDNFTEISKTLAGQIFGSESGKSKNNGLGVDSIDLNDPLFYKSPIMKGLISIKNNLELLTHEDEEGGEPNDILIKMEICDLFIFFNDLRHDYLISNYICYFEQKLKKISTLDKKDRTYLLSRIGEEIEDDCGSIIPQLLETGIANVDAKYKLDDKLNLLNVMKNVKIPMTKNKKQNLSKKFINYTEEAEMPDLDSLLAKKMDNSLKIPILPSLLIIFYLNRDHKLENKILEFVLKYYNQRIEFKERLKQLEILFEKNDIKLYSIIQKKIHRLKILCERSEIWINEFLNDYQNINDMNEALKIIKELNLVFFIKKIDLNEDEINSYSESQIKKENIRKTRQNIFRFVKGYIPLVNLIKDSQNQMAKILKDRSITFEGRKLFLDILKLSYTVLKNFCYKNRENQKLLFPFIEYFLDEIEYDFGQTSLVSAIFESNNFLCENVVNTFELMKNKIFRYGRQTRFLEFFKVIQKCDDSYIIDNQILVANTFLPIISNYSESEKLLYGTFNMQGKKEFEFDFAISKEGYGFYRDEPYYYHKELIEVLIYTIKGNEGQSINLKKIQEYFKMRKLLPYLFKDDTFFKKERDEEEINEEIQNESFAKDFHKLIDNCLPLLEEPSVRGNTIIKPSVLDLVNMIYFNPQKINLDKIYKNYDGICRYLEMEKNRIKDIPDFEALYSDELKYLFEYFLDFAKTYHKKVLSPEMVPDFRERNEYKFLLQVGNKLEENFMKYKGKLDKNKNKNLFAFFASFKDINFVTKDKLKNLPDEENKFEFEPLELKQEEVKELEFMWESVLKSFLNSQTLETEIENERDILGEALINIGDLFTPDMKKNYKIDITFPDILQKLINFLNYGIVNKADKKTMIYVLILLENIIDKSTNKIEIQNLFDKYEATKMFLNLISDGKTNIIEDDLLNQLLSFMIKLLEGGNLKVQKTIYNFFIYYPKSETLFWKLHSIIIEAINFITDDKKTLKSSTITSNDDFSFDLINSKENLKSELLEKTLRLLQLFTEGHNLDLQNYVRFQTNSRNNYDMVAAIVELLEAYHKNLDVRTYNNYVKCLDTLIEFVQGPCTNNQQSIIDGKFLEIANSLLSNGGKKNDNKIKENKKFEKKKSIAKNPLSEEVQVWMIERLKLKCMLLVISLVEMKKDNSVLKRIIRSLPLEILKQNIITIYKRYKKFYKEKYIEECLKHNEPDPYDRNNEERIEYYECIIETGFYIYFLILHYLQLDIKELDADISNELQEIELDVNVSSKGLLNLKDNIFGQIIEFLQSILSSLYHYVEWARIKLKKLNWVQTSKDEKSKEKAKKEIYKEALRFFDKNSAHIEVVRNDDLEVVHFIILPFCHYLPKEAKIDFHENVNRTSAKSKVSDLNDFAKKLIEIAKHEQKLAWFLNQNKIIAIFAKYIKLWKDLSFLCSIILNIFIVLSFSISDDDASDKRRFEEPSLLHQLDVKTTQQIFRILGIFMTACTCFVVGFFFLKKAPLILKEAWGEGGKRKGLLMGIVEILFWIIKFAIKFLNNFELIYYIIYGLLAVLGAFVHEFFFTFHLTEILVRFPYVIKAVYEPRKQLLLTLILFVLIEYFFTVFAYIWFYDLYGFRCETILFCFIETFDNTFKNNGGIGSFYAGIDAQTNNNYKYGRFFFENLFNIVLVIILINIFSGIIIDKFGDLRESENEKAKDIEGLCFICGNSKEEFDRRTDKKGGFTTHIKKDHYMWNYLFYIAYLDYKDPTEYTGIESFVNEKIKNYDFTWFPINRALALRSFETDGGDIVSKQLKNLENDMRNVKKYIKDMNVDASNYDRLFKD